VGLPLLRAPWRCARGGPWGARCVERRKVERWWCTRQRQSCCQHHIISAALHRPASQQALENLFARMLHGVEHCLNTFDTVFCIAAVSRNLYARS
jgi:hypothetical protein